MKTPLMKSRKRCRTKISASGRKGRANYGAPFLYADKKHFSGPGMRQQQDRAGGIARRCVCSTSTQAGPEGKETCQNQCGGSAECARPPDPGESPESRLPGRPDWQVADRAQSDGGCGGQPTVEGQRASVGLAHQANDGGGLGVRTSSSGRKRPRRISSSSVQSSARPRRMSTRTMR